MQNTTKESPAKSFLIILVITDSLLVIFGVLGNTVVIVYNAFLKVNKKPTNYFVLNLAISDLMVCGIYFPTYITEAVRMLLGTAEGANLVCKISFTITGISLATSVMNIMVLTIDRYISISLPLKYPTIVTPTKTRMALALVWCVGFLQGTLVFVSTRSTGVPLECEVDLTVGTAATVLCFYIPLTTTVVFNWKVLRIAQAQRRKIATQAGKSEASTSFSRTGFGRRHFLRQFRLFKTFAVVFGCFLFCVTPFPVLAMIHVLVCNACIPLEALCATAILAGANSVLDAYIYGMRHEEYRRVFRILLSKQCMLF